MRAIAMRATTHFYDSNRNPKQVRRGDVFEVNDEVQAKDYAHLAVPHKGDEKPAPPDPVVPEGTVTGVERKARETPLNKMNPAPANKSA